MFNQANAINELWDMLIAGHITCYEFHDQATMLRA